MAAENEVVVLVSRVVHYSVNLLPYSFMGYCEVVVDLENVTDK